MRRSAAILAAIAAVAVASVITLPSAVAGAATGGLWVSNVAPLSAAPGISCTQPGYSTIQSAINAATTGATIHVCAGTYTQQLTITKSVSLVAVGSVTAKLPASPGTSTTSCDNAIGAVSQQPQDEISICGAAVSITGITVSAYWPANTCYDSLYGVFVGKGSSLVSSKLAVEGAGVPIGDPDVGCQGGVAIEVGSARTTPNEAATATLKNTTVSGYQKNGITAVGTGTSLSINKADVTGRGPVATAENGIEVAFGAKASVVAATVTANRCTANVCGSDSLADTQASGVLLYGAASGTKVSKSSISNNDMGVYYGSTAATEPSSPEVTISGNQFSGTADEQVLLDQGYAVVKSNTISGPGNVGIQTIQYQGQSYAPRSTAAYDTISGQGIGVQVYSDHAATGDFPGTFTINNSTYLTGNTLASKDNSTNFYIQGVGNH